MDMIVDSHRQLIEQNATFLQDIELVFQDSARRSVPYNKFLLTLQVPHLKEYLSSNIESDQVLFDVTKSLS